MYLHQSKTLLQREKRHLMLIYSVWRNNVFNVL